METIHVSGNIVLIKHDDQDDVYQCTVCQVEFQTRQAAKDHDLQTHKA